MPRKATVKTEEIVDSTTALVAEGTVKKQEYKPKKRKLEPNTMVVVRNGFNGRLVYVSSRTHERFVWDGFGAELDMELQDLRAAKNSSKAYFENNWFLIDDRDILEYLGVERMYRNSLSLEKFDELFLLPPTEIAEKIQSIPAGQKSSVIYRAKQLIADGAIDSIKVINALEKGLGVELIER